MIYTPEENWQRHQIQQRYWRFGRGEDTPEDHRAEQLEQMVRRQHEKYGGEPT